MERILVGRSSGLKGALTVQGGKNAVLPIMAASILTKERVRIHNCPDIEDVRNTIELLEMLGCRVSFENGTLDIDAADVADTRVSGRYTESTRSSINFLGAMLGRLKKTVITLPGGCRIGARPIDMHMKGIRRMNVTIFEKYGDVIAYSDEIKGTELSLPMPSVGATENLMLTAALAKGITTIRNAAREPEIQELAAFINSMGGKIRGAGSPVIEITGVDVLHGTDYTVGGDRIVAATYMAAAAVCGGRIILYGIRPSYMEAVIASFRYAGMNIRTNERKQKIVCRMAAKKGKTAVRSIPLTETEGFPGFPTDVQPILAAVMAYGTGVSRIRENIFENRFAYIGELKAMGADINVKGRDSVTIYGGGGLKGGEVKAMDLRGAAALVVAGLGADGTTIVDDTQYIRRGYENIVRDLQILGADIREETDGDDEEREKK